MAISRKLRQRFTLLARYPLPLLLERLAALSPAELRAWRRLYGICRCLPARDRRRGDRRSNHEPGRAPRQDEPAEEAWLSPQSVANIHAADKLTGRQLVARLSCSHAAGGDTSWHRRRRRGSIDTARRRSIGNLAAGGEATRCRCGATARARSLSLAVQALVLARLNPEAYREPRPPALPAPSATTHEKSFDLAARVALGRGLWHEADFLQRDTLDALGVFIEAMLPRTENGYDQREGWTLGRRAA